MAEMIKKKSISYRQIKSDISEYLQSLDNWEEIKDNLPASNLTIITDLMAGFGSYIVYKHQKLREETYLSTAKLDQSVYDIARTFGYEIKRYSAPAVKFKYFGVETVRVQTGDVLGIYGDYDVVYFGDPVILEKLDTITAYVGTMIEIENQVNYVNDNLRYRLIPEIHTAVDNNLIKLFIDEVEKPITRDIEEYVTQGSIVDYSLTPFSTDLFCSDRANNYGISPDELSKVKIQYMETDGIIPEILLDKIETKANYSAIEIDHYGSNGQSVEQIRQLAPLFYSTQRRMVTKRDHQYISEAHAMIRSAYPVKDEGVAEKIKLTFTPAPEGTLYTIGIETRDYEFTSITGNLSDVLVKFDLLLKGDSLIVVSEIGEDYLILTNRKSGPLDDIRYSAVNIAEETLVEGIKGKCCTVNLYYVKYTTVEDPILLTLFEQIEFAKYLEYYKMVGVRLILVPADVTKYSMMIKIRLIDNSYEAAVKNDIKALLNTYELKLDTKFDYGEFLTRVAQIRYITEDNEVIYPIKSALPDQVVYNIPASIDTYIKFNNVSITLD